MLHLLRSWLALAAVLLSLPCAGQGSTPLLYEVKSPTTTLYLFGTIHVGTRDMYPLGAQVEQAFAEAGVLALEADPTGESISAVALAGSLYRPPDSLERHVSAEMYGELAAKLPGFGLPLEHARMLEPHLLAMTITLMQVQRLGYEPALGLDLHFAQRARRVGKPIIELESMVQQLAMLDALPKTVQEDMLRAAVKMDDEELGKELKALVQAWQSGDIAGIERAVVSEMEAMDRDSVRTLQARVYDERNAAMAQKLKSLLEGRTVHFVAIGAGHLTGASGLPVLLEGMGFRVRLLQGCCEGARSSQRQDFPGSRVTSAASPAGRAAALAGA